MTTKFDTSSLFRRATLCGFAFLLSTSLALSQGAPTYLIDTFAGTGTQGFGGDGGPARLALLNLTTNVTLDSEGNLYLVDWNARIREVSVRTGIIETVAGNGQPGWGGDGGPAIDAMIGYGGGLGVDPAGNIYLADSITCRVRFIDKRTGIITTIAGDGTCYHSGIGGPATAAGVGSPAGIAFDREGNLYFADSTDGVFRVDAKTGIVTEVAGGNVTGFSGDGGPATAALLCQPSDVAIAGNGDLFIVDRGSHRIRKVSAATGIITTVAGSSPCVSAPPPFGSIPVCQGGFSGDGGPATSALLNDPQNLALDGRGNLYISDTLNQRIRFVEARTGIINTIAGTGVEGFSGDLGPAVSAQLNDPSGIVVSKNCNVYFGDQNNNRVRVLYRLKSLDDLTAGGVDPGGPCK
jgi:hypothetical protein